MRLRNMYLNAVILAACVFAAPLSHSVAEAACDSAQPSAGYFDGAYHTNTSVGAMAYITNQDAKLCGAPWSDSSAWAMTAHTGQNVYLQAGIGKSASDSTMLMFSEWKPRIGNFRRVVSYHPLGATWYKAGLDTINKDWYLAWSGDGTTWNNLDIVPDSSLQWLFFGDQPNETQYFAEVHDSHDAVFGSSVSKGTWSSMKYKSASTAAWNAEFGVTTWVDSQIAGHAQLTFISNTNFQVWDTQN